MFLMLLALAAPPDTGWKFVDESTHDGRSVLTFRTAELSETPGKPPHPDDALPLGAKFATLRLGPDGKQRNATVWHAATSTVWIDADGDGRFAATERHTLGTKPIEILIKLQQVNGPPVLRTLLVRKRGDGFAYTVRGYTIGTITIAGKAVVTMLTDGDGDGCFDAVGSDRIWLDLDGDGKFDPLTEQFSLGNAIPHAGTALLVRPQPDGLTVVVRERPSEAGTLTLDVSTLAGAEVIEFTAQLVSEFGELVVVRQVGQELAVPAGKYYVKDVLLKLGDGHGKAWRYRFYGDQTPTLQVAKGERTMHKLLTGLTITLDLDTTSVAKGAQVFVAPTVQAGGLYLSQCEVGDALADHGRDLVADFVLTEPGSVPLDRTTSAFN